MKAPSNYKNDTHHLQDKPLKKIVVVMNSRSWDSIEHKYYEYEILWGYFSIYLSLFPKKVIQNGM